MSLSLQSARRTDRKRTSAESTSQKIHWWDELPAVLTCPECGERAMRRVAGPCHLLDGTSIPVLERFQCSSCQANFFDNDAMKTIDAFREKASQKPAIARRTKRMKAAA